MPPATREFGFLWSQLDTGHLDDDLQAILFELLSQTLLWRIVQWLETLRLWVFRFLVLFPLGSRNILLAEVGGQRGKALSSSALPFVRIHLDTLPFCPSSIVVKPFQFLVCKSQVHVLERFDLKIWSPKAVVRPANALSVIVYSDGCMRVP